MDTARWGAEAWGGSRPPWHAPLLKLCHARLQPGSRAATTAASAHPLPPPPAAPPLQAQVGLDARLTLAHSGATVQLSDAALQLGQRYACDPGADFVLAVTSATSGAEVARWTALARRLGSRAAVWNVSMYGGLDLGFVRRDGGSLARELRGRVLIVLNAPYALDATRTKQVVPDNLRVEEVFAGERRACARLCDPPMPPCPPAAARAGADGSPGIRTLIVAGPRDADALSLHGVRPTSGSRGVDYPHARPGTASAGGSGGETKEPLLSAGHVSPAAAVAHSGGDVHDAVRVTDASQPPVLVSPCVVRYGRRDPRAADVAAKAAALSSRLGATHPTEQHLVVHHFSPAAEPLARGCCSETRSLGLLRVFAGLSAVTPCVATTLPGPRCSDDQHAFAMAKLLPFERKLAYVAHAVGDAGGGGGDADAAARLLQQLLLPAVLSDLADEQWAWRREAWSGDYPRARLERPDCLAVLRSFVAAAAAGGALLRSSQGGERALLWLTSRVQALVDALPSTLDYCWFFRRQRIVSAVSTAILRPLVAQLPAAAFQAAHAEARADYRRSVSRGGRELLWESIRNPLGDHDTAFQHRRPAAYAESEASLVAAGTTQPLIRRIVEAPYSFGAGPAGDAAREAAAASFEQLAHGDARPVALFPLRPGAWDAPDNVESVRAYRGAVRA